MEAKHTPGPWEWIGKNSLYANSDEILMASDDGKPYGMHSAQIEHHWDSGVAKANMNLIAAAPELLEALQKIARMDYGNPYAKACADVARESILKATGETA